MNQSKDASTSNTFSGSNVSVAKKASASIVLAFTLLYVSFQGAWSSNHDEAQIDALITDLGAVHPSKRYDARRALREIGKPAVPALNQALTSDDVEVRVGAVDTLGQIGPDAEAALPALITILEDEMIRSDAARALAEIGPAAVPFLVDALANPNRNVSGKAIWTIGSIAEDAGEAGEAVPALMALMRNPESAGEPDWPHDKQLDAHMTLFKSHSPEIAEGWNSMANVNEMVKDGAAFGSEDEKDALLIELDKARQQMMRGLPAFNKALEASGPRSSLRPNIATALGDIGAPAVPALLELLTDADADFRRMSTIAFREMGEEVNDDFDEPMDIGDKVEPAVAGLTYALADEDADVQSGAVSALAAFGSKSLPSLIDALDDGEVARRANAAKALSKIEPPAEDAVPALAGALDDEHAEVRQSVIRALVAIGPAASSTAPRLGQLLLNDNDPEVRKIAAEALWHYSDETTIPMLVEAIGDDDSHVRRMAGESLYAFGETPIPALVQALGHEKEMVRSNAVRLLVLQKSAASPARARLSELLLSDDDHEVRRTAAEGLGTFLDESAIPALIEANGDDDLRVRVMVRISLHALGEAPIPALIQALGHEKESVRTNAEEFIILKFLNGAPPLLINALEDALDDDSDVVRERAKALLEQRDRDWDQIDLQSN